jgi:hypothetical protein
MKSKGNQYDKDFKQMIVVLYNISDHTYASLESEYDDALLLKLRFRFPDIPLLVAP